MDSKKQKEVTKLVKTNNETEFEKGGSEKAESRIELCHPEDFPNPFSVDPDKLPIPEKLRPTFRFIFPAVKRMLCLSQLEKGYDEMPPWNGPTEFFKTTLEHLGVNYELFPTASIKLPKDRPLIIVSNHPFGALEALVMYEVIRKERPDLKFLANFMLGRLKPAKDLFILVDPFEREKSKKDNVNPMREALSWLKNDHALITFPSGTVSHFHTSSREVQDPIWNTNIARLVKKTGATVVPCFIHGRNSLVFQLAGLIHPILRTMLLPRQLLNKKNKTIAIQIGKPIVAEKLKRFESNRELTDYLRMRCYLQKNSPIKVHEVNKRTKSPISEFTSEIIDPVASNLLEQDFSAISDEKILIERNDLAVAITTMAESPNLLQEVGRLREITFRDVGEGTGTECDLDFFDSYYKHLICWDRKAKKVVGAYRVVKTDEAVASYGLKGLYTNTLFHYNKDLLKELGPSLEVGRSFVAQEYQRTLWPLMLLLKGLSNFVALNPDYKTMFGPVSVSGSFTGVSRHLLELFLRENNFQPLLAQHVRPRTSSEPERVLGIDQEFFSKTVKDISEVSELIQDIELKEMGVPVLLKEYTKLGGKIIGFNVDHDFNGALDGLIVVDFSKADRRLLNKYLGEFEAAKFLKYHQDRE